MKNFKFWVFISVCVLACVSMPLAVWLATPQPEPEPVVVLVESSFDTEALDGWCGDPAGRIRMVGAWVYEPGTLEDETGNLWGWDGDLEEDGFYLLWIDDLGDDLVQNDEIIKVWQEK